MHNSKLKERRLEQGLTQVEVANKANISERYYQKLETQNSTPAVDIAIKLANILDSTVESLFGTFKK